MRWPFGPPHLTLKPSKKNQKRSKKTKIYKKNKPKTKKPKKKTKSKKNTIPKKELFSYQSKCFFFGGSPKIAFFDNLAQKARTPKTL